MSKFPSFEPFEIKFGSLHGDQFDLDLTHHGGQSDGFGAFTPPEQLVEDESPAEAASKDDSEETTRGLVGKGKSGKSDDDGKSLFKALITDSAPEGSDTAIQKNYTDKFNAIEKDGARALRITLRFNPKKPGMGRAIHLPWEKLFDTLRYKRYLNLWPEKCSVVRYLDIGEKVKPVLIEGTLNILIVSAEPDDHPALDLEGEKQKIKAEIGGNATISLHFMERGENESTEEALRRTLASGSFHVFHYLGHGGYDKELGEGVLLFEDADNHAALMSSTNLGQMLLDAQSSIKLVFLNACDTAVEKNPFTGVAQRLVQLGTPAVVAMQKPIDDRGAVVFAKTFYSLLANKESVPIDYAITMARTEMEKQKSTGWSTPVLYMQAIEGDGILFKSGDAPAQEKKGIKNIFKYLKSKKFKVTRPSARVKEEEKLDLTLEDNVRKIVESRKKEIESCDAILICWITGTTNWKNALNDYIEEIRSENPPEIFYLVSGENDSDKEDLLDFEGDEDEGIAVNALPSLPDDEETINKKMTKIVHAIQETFQDKVSSASPIKLHFEYLLGDDN